MAGFYTARSRTIPPLPWSNFAPPFSLMVLQLQTPRQPSYVYVSYVQADGSVVTLLQPESDLIPERSAELITFGDGAEGRAKFTACASRGTKTV